MFLLKRLLYYILQGRICTRHPKYLRCTYPDLPVLAPDNIYVVLRDFLSYFSLYSRLCSHIFPDIADHRYQFFFLAFLFIIDLNYLLLQLLCRETNRKHLKLRNYSYLYQHLPKLSMNCLQMQQLQEFLSFCNFFQYHNRLF